MKFLREQGEIDFKDTAVPNIFIEDFMPVANGDFVKVYLYALKNFMSEMDNEKIAKNLNLNIADVEKAWDYWEQEGIVKKEFKTDGRYDLIFLDIKKYYIENMSSNPKPKKPTQEETLIDSITNSEAIRQMFANIDYYMRRQTTPTEKMEVISWITEYNMAPEMISTAFEYAVEKKKKVSVRYVRPILISWYDKKISTLEDAESEIQKSDEKYVRKNKVLRKMGLINRMVTEAEIKAINSWYDEMNFEENIIDEAISRCKNIKAPSINYVDAILKNWKKLNIQTLEDIQKLDKKPEREKVSKTKFHNFEGDSDNLSREELNKLAKNLMQKRNKEN